MVFGHPVTVEAQPVGQAGELDGFGDRIARRGAGTDRGLVEN